MAHLFGRLTGRRDLLLRAGDLSQVAGIRMMTLGEGEERGVRIADFRTGSGLRFQVTLDRGMDISAAEYRGIPLAYRSPAGDVHPSRFDPVGAGWLRTFPGGLMTGCGMTYLGAPCTDQGVELGLHGRLSHLPAAGVSSEHRWEGDECTFLLSGSMRESTMFGENLLLRRSISAGLGRSEITVRDRVSNEGKSPSPLMMLYHINAGWPLLDEGARLLTRSARIVPRDPAAEAGIRDARSFSGPLPGFAEQVFYHDPVPDEKGFALAMLHNSRLRIGLWVMFRTRELPRLAEWKMMGEGTYVLGIEPANCGVQGRAFEREAGTLQFLGPGEERDFEVRIGVAEGDEISSLIARHGLS